MSGAPRGLDWAGLMRMGMGSAQQGGLGLAPAAFWQLTPAELSLMLGIEALGAAGMTRQRLAELEARFPDQNSPKRKQDRKGPRRGKQGRIGSDGGSG